MDSLQARIFGVRKMFEGALANGKFKGDPVAFRQYIDQVTAIPLPKINAKRVVVPDFKPHDENEVISLQGVKAKRAADATARLGTPPQEVPPSEAEERKSA